MALNIYDVIFYEADGQPDTIYVVAAHSHLEAVQLAERDRTECRCRDGVTRSNKADTVSLVGQSLLTSPDPQIIHGPFLETGYTRGATWRFDEQTKEWLTHEDYYKPRTGS